MKSQFRHTPRHRHLKPGKSLRTEFSPKAGISDKLPFLTGFPGFSFGN